MISISTITPCYNMGKYFKIFLDELPKQENFDEIEIVLDHNDPSKEELRLVEIFQKEHPHRLKHIVTSPVEPIGVSMNTCIKHAEGDLLAIWNVDDLRTPYGLLKQAEKIRTDNYDVVHGNFVQVNQFGNRHGKLFDHTQYKDKHPVLHTGMCYGPFFMFKKELLEHTGYFDEQLKSGADYDFCMRLGRQGTVGTIPTVLGYYLNEGKGASTNGDGLQPIERTVVEMRYGMHEKIDPQYVASVLNYDLNHVVNFGNHVKVKDLI
jgi:GT2 family glycosyltransferase